MAIFRFLALALGWAFIQSCATTQVPSLRLSLKDLAGHSKATVFVWWATQCPCVSRYQSRIEALERAYASKGVAFYAIASNSDDDQARVETIAEKRGFTLPILIDNGGALAAQLGARTTPTIVIVDKSGTVRYRGWIDNERQLGESGRIAFAENALNDVIVERPVERPTSPIYGCRITKRLR